MTKGFAHRSLNKPFFPCLAVALSFIIISSYILLGAYGAES